jgi:hypothetical protein
MSTRKLAIRACCSVISPGSQIIGFVSPAAFTNVRSLLIELVPHQQRRNDGFDRCGGQCSEITGVEPCGIVVRHQQDLVRAENVIFECVRLQQTAGAVTGAGSAVQQADSVHLDARRVDRYPIAGDAS